MTPALQTTYALTFAAQSAEILEWFNERCANASFTESARITWDCDGLSAALSTDTNMLGLLYLELHGLNHLDWGIGLGEVFDDLSGNSCVITANGLGYIGDLFNAMNEQFYTMLPEVNASTIATVRDALVYRLSHDLRWGLPESAAKDFDLDYAVTVVTPFATALIARMSGDSTGA